MVLNAGIYIHIPFCEKRCGYCDFNTYAGKLQFLPEYIDSLGVEMEKVTRAYAGRIRASTVYFGGGTPSLIDLVGLAQVMRQLQRCMELDPSAEVTLEANPGTVSQAYLVGLRQLGFNRLSIGMQSARESELQLLERIHNWADVVQAVGWARAAGFSNLSLDLIYGLPSQRIEDWQFNLQQALQLNPEHLSLYALTLEPHVPLSRRIRQGVLPGLDEDAMADMYDVAMDKLGAAGYEHYEISNWARKDASGNPLVSRHNQQYWRNLPYLGFGAGAHGYAVGVRTENVLRIGTYIERCCRADAGLFPHGPALKTAVQIDRRREMQETMMLGLRLAEGVSSDEFATRFGQTMDAVFHNELARLLHTGLVEQHTDGRVRLTRRGRFLSNMVFREFVD